MSLAQQDLGVHLQGVCCKKQMVLRLDKTIAAILLDYGAMALQRPGVSISEGVSRAASYFDILPLSSVVASAALCSTLLRTCFEVARNFTEAGSR